MDGAGGDPHFLVALDLGVVVQLEVREGYEVVGVSVDEEHRAVALGQLLDGRGFPEAPAVFLFRHQAGALEHIRRDEPEAFLAIVVELPDHGGVAAVLDEAADVFRQRIAAGHHDGRGAHGHAVQHHEVIFEDFMRDLRPLLHVVAVVPAHLDVVALRIAVVLQVREEHVVIELVAVHPNQVKEHDVVVSVTVHHDGGAAGRGGILRRHVAGVYLEVVVSCNGGVFQHAQDLERIVPGRAAGHQGIRFVACALDVLDPVGSRRKCVSGQVFP